MSNQVPRITVADHHERFICSIPHVVWVRYCEARAAMPGGAIPDDFTKTAGAEYPTIPHVNPVREFAELDSDDPNLVELLAALDDVKAAVLKRTGLLRL